MSLTLSSPSIPLSTQDTAAEAPLSSVDPAPARASASPAPPRSQTPVVDVVEHWGLASFPASDPPSNW
ncbi:hypothetical protein [Candidatus Blastococcus massiliensis]|uniref:hypothetical protein n=1 Tax=Candidatus Blastococcus massiliensis TaxID=1470358 RepID=UPI0004B87F05|nr:hypothetical protein [Candidatus Blastococcus massiliensis]